MKDFHSDVKVSRLISPAAIINGNGTTTSQTINTSGYDGLEFVFIPGTITDGTFTVTIYESSDSGMAGETAVTAANLLGSAPTLAAADSDTPHRVGYRGGKQYVRAKAVQAGAAVGGYLGALAIQGIPHAAPVAED